MTKTLSGIILFFFLWSCISPRKACSSESNTAQQPSPKEQFTSKQIAPGTCSLVLSDYKLTSNGTTHWLNGTVEVVKAYGAGFSMALEKGENIKIKLTEKQSKALSASGKISCTISKTISMDNSYYFEMLDYQK